MIKDFTGKTAIVTGSSGIGLGAALRLARGGANVHICGIDPAHNQQAKVDGVGLDFHVYQVDVAQEKQVSDFVSDVAAAAGKIDILINSAAVQTYGNIETTDVEHWDRVMAVNLRSCFLLSHFIYPHMKKTGAGSIVHLSSGQGHANQNNVLAYATTKGAIHTLTRAMAVDCAKDNIRVNSVSPGSIRTPLLEFAAQKVAGEGNSIEETIAEFGASHPIGRVGTIEEVAELIAFLVGEKSSFCTGGDYPIDGGLMAHLAV